MPPKPTAAHYARQKSQSYTHFRVRALPEEGHAMKSAQFTIYDFVTNAFAFSRPRKELAVKVFEQLQHKPHTFAQLREALGAGKSNLFLILVSLERSGLIEKGDGALIDDSSGTLGNPNPRGVPYRLSSRFSNALRQYAGWWERWVANQSTGTNPSSPALDSGEKTF